MKVKIFDYEDESDLQKAMNEFLGDLDGEVVDIKYAVSSFPSGEEQIYCFSAMIIYYQKTSIKNDVLLDRRIEEYLTSRCGFYEIYTYPWIDEKYIHAAKIDISKSLKLARPPAPELVYLRSS